MATTISSNYRGHGPRCKYANVGGTFCANATGRGCDESFGVITRFLSRKVSAGALILAVCGLAVLPAGATELVYPSADGTGVDGGIHGDFDGFPDAWDWTFDQSGYENAITLTTETPESSSEQRMVWEYDLSGLGVDTPVAATLTFTIRGAEVYPFPDSVVHIYSYPSDLMETDEDYAAGPAVFQGSVTVCPFQQPTVQVLNVTVVVNEAMSNGSDKVAFRFQITPDTPHDANQAFIDALDEDPQTKPHIRIIHARSGDADADNDVDLYDYAIFFDCVGGPDQPPTPTLPDVTLGDCLTAFDFDLDSDVDVADFSGFQLVFGEK